MKPGSSGLGRVVLRQSLALSLLPLLVVGTFAYFAAARSLEQRIRELLETRAVELSDTIQSMLDRAATDTTTWARLSVFKGALIFDSFEKSEQYLADFADAYSDYRALHLYDGNGNLVASSSSPDAVSGEDVALALTGEHVTSGTRRGERGLGVVFAVPVRDGGDVNVTGALVLELDWEIVLQRLAATEERGKERGASSHRIFLVDADATLIGGTEASSLLRATLALGEAERSALDRQTGSTRSWLEGVEQLVGYAPFDGGGFRGACLVTESLSEALAPVTRLGFALLFSAVLAAVAAALCRAS